MSWLPAAALALNVVVLGLHAVAPFRLARGDDRARGRWAAVALPALLAAIVVTAATIARRPDEAIAWGLVDPLHGSSAARLISLALAALVLADGVLAIGWRRFEPAAWRLLGVLGGLGAAAQTFGSELLRIGWAPLPSTVALLAAAALRLPLDFAAGELALGRPALWAPLAGPCLVLATRFWTPAMWHGLGATRWTLLAGALLLVASRFVPPTLRRLCGVAGLALALAALAGSAEVGRVLGGREAIPDALLEP